MRFKCGALGLLLLMATAPKNAWAQFGSQPFFQSSRSLSMGDAFTGYDAGYDAVYYNPAGVAHPSPPQGKYIDLEMEGSTGDLSFLENTTKSFGSLTQLAQNLTATPGVVDVIGLALLPQFMAKNFSIGLIARGYSQSEVDPTTSNLNFLGYADLGIYAQFGVSFFGGIVKVGVGLKALDRAELNQSYTPAQYASGLNLGNQWQEGLGYGLDLGILVTAPITGLPTFGLSILDFGNTTFQEDHVIFTSANATSGVPPPIQQRVNFGYSMTFKNAPGVKTVVSADFKDILRVSQGIQERICAGTEITIHDFISLRAGLYQGQFWTAGLGLKIDKASLEFATYGENLMADTGNAPLDDRKVILRYVLGF